MSSPTSEFSLSEVLEKLSQKLNEDIVVQESLESEYLLTLSHKISKWQALYSKKLREFKYQEQIRDVKFRELYMYYQHEFNIKLDKKELNTFISADTEFRQIRTKLDELEVQLDFIEKAIKTLEGQSWNLKNRLAYLQVLGFVDS